MHGGLTLPWHPNLVYAVAAISDIAELEKTNALPPPLRSRPIRNWHSRLRRAIPSPRKLPRRPSARSSLGAGRLNRFLPRRHISDRRRGLYRCPMERARLRRSPRHALPALRRVSSPPALLRRHPQRERSHARPRAPGPRRCRLRPRRDISKKLRQILHVADRIRNRRQIRAFRFCLHADHFRLAAF